MSVTKPIKLPLTTHCACGAIGLTLTGQPLSMMMCSCHNCQKASGTGHTALTLVHAKDIELEGETRGFTVTAASGHPTTRHFCPTCGTPLYGQPQQYPDLRLLHAGLFENNDWFHPTTAIFHRSHMAWDVLPDIPTYETYKED